jgi:hypothetical protein
MTEPGKKKNKLESAAKMLSLLIVTVLGILLLLVLAIKIYLTTARPAPQLSRYLTSYLHQGFSVQSLDISGATVVLKGVRLQNPAGFPEGDLVAADSVAIAPQWRDLLFGRQRFRLIRLEGIKVNLTKDSQGAWNFARLQRLFGGRKPSPTETYLKELVIKDGAFKVQGQGVQGVELQVFNLTTKGSLDSKVDLVFEDAAHNRYSLKGKARAGSDAALDLALTAPSISLKDAALLLKLKNPGLFEGGKGNLQLNASLHKGELGAIGDFSFSGLGLPGAAKGPPLTGDLHFSADYSFNTDIARLQPSTLTVNNLTKLHAAGNVRGLKSEREFALYLGMDEIDLANLNSMVPEEARKHLLFGGRLRCDSLHLVGSGSKGLKSAVGTLQLRDGALTRDGQLLVSGLFGTIGVSRSNAAILAKGRLQVSGQQGKALLEALDIPFGLTVSPRLKPVSAEIPALSVKVMGTPISGRLNFDAARSNPITASLKVSAARLSTVNSLLKRYDLHASSGTASAAIELAGKSAQELTATANVQLSDLRGNRAKESFALKNGSVTARVQRTGGHLLAQGDMKLSALALNGKAGDARFGYRVADGMLYLDGAQVGFAGAQVAISHLSGRIPAKQPAGSSARYPLSLDFDGVSVKQRDMEIGNLSGRLRGSFNTDSAGRWLEGAIDVSSRTVNWQGNAVAAPVAHAAFSRAGGRGELSGQLLGGKLAGTVSFNPFAPEAGGSFDVGLTGAKLAAAAPFLPKGSALHPSDGLIDLHLKGGYSRRDALACRFDAKGSGIVLTGGAGKNLVSGAALALSGALAGGNLSVTEAVLSPGKGVALTLKGELAQALSPKRSGSIVFSLPDTALTGLIDSFVNVAPRIIQEATVDGTVAANGKVDLQDGKQLVEGALSFKGGRVEVASQKLLLADINGRLPFSLDLSGKAGGKPPYAMAFSRENYPRLLEQLRLKSTGGGQAITIGKIGFGTLELGKSTIQVSAVNGITEIASFSTSLSEGTVLGRGYISKREKLSYRGDLLINGLSLRALCSKFPDIKGYISGRVDGVLSLNGVGTGIGGMTGFTNLWAREGRGEKMLVSKEFLQRLAKQKLSGFFFSSDRHYDQAEIKATLEEGDLTFETLKIAHTNPFGVRDLNVSIAPAANRIALDHLLESIKEAAVRGKPSTGAQPAAQPGEQPTGQPAETAPTQEFKWGE